MVTWFGNMKTMWKLILGSALTGMLVAVMGGAPVRECCQFVNSCEWSMKITPSQGQTSPSWRTT